MNLYVKWFGPGFGEKDFPKNQCQPYVPSSECSELMTHQIGQREKHTHKN